jgi:actin-like ATPase involved in cell morphogenesis
MHSLKIRTWLKPSVRGWQNYKEAIVAGYITVEVDLSDYMGEIRETLGEEKPDLIKDLFREFNLFGKQALLKKIEEIIYQEKGVRISLTD